MELCRLLHIHLEETLVERIQRLVPAVNGGDDAAGIGSPCEGLGVDIGLGEEAV